MATDKQYADSIQGATALHAASVEEGQLEAGADTLEGAGATAPEDDASEEVDLEAVLGGGIRKAPAAVTTADEPEVAASH